MVAHVVGHIILCLIALVNSVAEQHADLCRRWKVQNFQELEAIKQSLLAYAPLTQ